ncbi:hypothetical protein HMPREF0379_1453 [[Eubacterium] yurii subsp. margaretiae ATCC 43715]|nr:hypothetical protein HMPREF0379_1453 [[Eubacterium] yurii subsp. margaretiae ATCC 43715]
MKVKLKRNLILALLIFGMVSMNSYADINDEITKTYDSVDAVITKSNEQNKTTVQNKNNKVTTDTTVVFDNSNGQTNTNNKANTNNQPNQNVQTDTNNLTNTTNQSTTDGIKNYNFLEKVENSNVVVKLASQSKEELQSLYNRGFRVFEITVSLTRDGQLVLADNFSQYFEKYYGKKINIPSIDEYFTYKMVNSNSQMSLGDINVFLDRYPDARFIVRTFDYRNSALEIIKSIPFKNKDKLVIGVTDSLASYKSLKSIAIVDLKGEGDIRSYISRNSDKYIIFIYQNVLPSKEEIDIIKQSGNKIYELKKADNNANVDGYIYSIEQAVNLNIKAVQSVATNFYQRPAIKNDRFIAHAGGEYAGLLLTNALQSMKNSYSRGNRLLEIDFDWTTDGKAVQVHDWATFSKLTNSDVSISGYYMNYEEFKNKKMIYYLQQMSIDDTAEFLKQHTDAYVITDVKEDNMKSGNFKLLSEFAQNHPSLMNRVIPQIYNTSEYAAIRDLGYKHIIYTLYRTEQSSYNVLEFAKSNDLFAITMDNYYRVYSALPSLLVQNGQRVYIHTENNKEKAKNFINSGKVYGIYSDNILSYDELNK